METTVILLIILSTFTFTQEFEIDGNLKVTGNIQAEIIDSLKQRISVLESKKYSGFKNILEFESGTYTWTVPDSVTTIFVEMWAGGGGKGSSATTCGGNSGSHTSCQGNPGGNGGYVKNYLSVKPDSTYEISIGASGGGGPTGCYGWNTVMTGGTDGSDSYFGNLLYATGGEGGCACSNCNCIPGEGSCNGDSNGESGIGTGGIITNPIARSAWNYGGGSTSGYMYIYY